MVDVNSLDFRTLLRDSEKGLVVKPILRNYLYNASFPDFQIRFQRGDQQRQPDGWFHPSTHPLWPDRALYHYLADPKAMVSAPLEYMNTLSIVFGTAFHDFVAMCLTDGEWLRRPEGTCLTCGDRRKSGCREWAVIDEEVGERGHLDGLSVNGDVFEFKTTNERRISKMEDMDLSAFRAVWPIYYAQQQSYLRISGRKRSVVLVLSLGFPWHMREFHVPRDESFCHEIETKYRRVRQQVADHQPGVDCCAGSKFHAECPARLVCPIGGK